MTVIKRQRSTIFSTYALPEPPLASAKIERDRGGTRSAPWQSDGRTLNRALNPVANLRRGGTAGHAAFRRQVRQFRRVDLLHARLHAVAGEAVGAHRARTRR